MDKMKRFDICVIGVLGVNEKRWSLKSILKYYWSFIDLKKNKYKENYIYYS